MLFSTRAEYGVRLMVELGRQEDGAPVALSAVAESETPAPLLPRAPGREAPQGRPGRAPARRPRRLPARRGPPRRSRCSRWSRRSRAPIAPMECFDARRRGQGLLLARERRRPRLRHQASVDPGAGRRSRKALAQHHARRAGRVRRAAHADAASEAAAVAAAQPTTSNEPGARMADLEIRNLHVDRRGQGDPQGRRPRGREGRGPRADGPERVRQVDPRQRDHGPPELRGDRGRRSASRARTSPRPSPDERSRAGLFMAFQYPVAIPGVTVAKYLRMAINAHREARGEEPIKLKEFRKDDRGGDGAARTSPRVLHAAT